MTIFFAYTEKERLGIDRAVDALALLMASTRTAPPLSIGVCGRWGSGKSFFLRHLRRRIWSLAEREQNRVAAWQQKRKSKTATADDAPRDAEALALAVQSRLKLRLLVDAAPAGARPRSAPWRTAGKLRHCIRFRSHLVPVPHAVLA
jgi:hypothetical protein